MNEGQNVGGTTIEDLTEIIFKLAEDISYTEETIEEIKKEQLRQAEILKTIKTTDSNNKNIEIETLIGKITALESKFQDINNTNELENISENLNQKSLLKKEITRYQSIIIGCLVFLVIIIMYFFGFVFDTQIAGAAIVVFLIAVLPFTLAIYFFNNNIKNLISQEKRISSKKIQI